VRGESREVNENARSGVTLGLCGAEFQPHLTVTFHLSPFKSAYRKGVLE